MHKLDQNPMFAHKYDFCEFVSVAAEKTVALKNGRFYLVPTHILKQPLLDEAARVNNEYAFFGGRNTASHSKTTPYY